MAGSSAARAIAHTERGVEEVRRHSGWWVDYLATGARMHYALWSYRFFDEALADVFPGITAVVLVVLAFRWPETRRDPRLRMCAVIAVGCAAMSMLPRTPIYPFLHRAILLFRAVRAPARLGAYVLLMVAVIGAYGVAGLGRRWRSQRTWPVVVLVLCLLVNVEALRAPLGYTPFSQIPRVYDVLASIPNAVIAELPLAEPQGAFGNAVYMLNSTHHWRPMINGYSGMRPDWYDVVYVEVAGFPVERSLAALRRIGVTHVVVHTAVDSLDRAPGLKLIAADGAIRIYQLQ